MVERPILFSDPMVRAILEGRKTQTRRIVKLPPASQGWRFIECAFNSDDSAHYHAGFAGNAGFSGSIVCVKCPYGKPPDPLFKTPGDRLWVREAWRTGLAADRRSGSGLECRGWPVFYEADGASKWTGASSGGPGFTTPGRYRHARFMPRWASRILLEITGVRVERLQQISEADAMAEGCPLINPDPFIPGHGGSSASGWYSQLWEDINGAGSWDANPWVWVVEFRALERGDA